MDDRVADLTARIARLERRLDATGPRGRVSSRVRTLLRAALPPETRGQLREARRRTWRAVRTVVDARIDRE